MTMTTDENIFAKRLRDVMKKRGENQTTLAAKITEQSCFIQRQSISLYVQGKNRPDTRRLTAICKAINVSADYLLGLSDTEHAQIPQEILVRDDAIRQLKTELKDCQDKLDLQEIGKLPGAKSEAGKLDLTQVPPEIIRAIAAIRDYGNRKYSDPDNWRCVEPQKFHAAMIRHAVAMWEDPWAIDPESGFPHLWHLACNAAFLCAMEGKNE